MPRITGSKNLPKDINYYRKKLKLAGINPADLIDKPAESTPEKPPEKLPEKSVEIPPEREHFRIKKPIVEDDIKETYQCGNCKANLDKPYGQCPQCNVYLQWG